MMRRMRAAAAGHAGNRPGSATQPVPPSGRRNGARKAMGKAGAGGPGTAAERSRPRKQRRKASGSGAAAAKRRRRRRGYAAARQPRRVIAPQRETGSSAAQAEAAYARGLAEGRYEGGERLLEQAAPPGLLLAGVELPQVIALGVEALRPTLVPAVEIGTVWQEMMDAMDTSQPYALVRLGDGELLALAHDLVLDTESIRREAPFVANAGIDLPDHAARGALADAVRRANVVGVPTSRRPHFQPLLQPALARLGIDYRQLRLTDSTINYSLYQTGLLPRLLEGRRVLAVGNEAPGMAERLQAMGVTVTGVIAPVNGFPDIDRVIGEASGSAFDIALVSAGIPAVVIAARIATELGKAALDFGHMADQIARGDVRF